jgi:phosphoribosylglycinamide formyltransferase-1
MNCAVFASGGGTNFQALLDHRKAGALHVDFTLLVGNNSKATAFARARRNGIDTLHISPSHFQTGEEYTGRLLSALRSHNVELLVLAGYMKKLPQGVIDAFRHRILNVHPALLPAFGGKGMYGAKVHHAVIESGVKLTGVTVHFADEEYDRGPIILQEPVRVYDNDTAETLAARVLEIEHATYWRGVEAVAAGRVQIKGNRVIGNV